MGTKTKNEKSENEEKAYLKAIIDGIAIDYKTPTAFADLKDPKKKS